MKNVICVPFAYKSNAKSGVNIGASGKHRLLTYLENACVALTSAKHYNMDAHVILATNLTKQDIPDEILKVFKRNNMEIMNIPYDKFCFPDEYIWSLAFYKLCVLKHLCDMGFEKVIYLDTDVYVQGNLTSVWKEIEDKILLYDINHGLEVEDYRILCNEVKNFRGEGKSNDSYITHYGGEFFASNYKNAVRFIEYAEKIFDEMLQKKFQTSKGDEFIISLAADKMREDIKNAGAYIYRFWTGANFRLVSTCYKYNKVLILHMPAEKEKGMLRIYAKYIVKGIIPSERIVWKICRLEHRTIWDYAGYQCVMFLNWIKKK